jgi:hypothetical protein
MMEDDFSVAEKPWIVVPVRSRTYVIRNHVCLIDVIDWLMRCIPAKPIMG